MDDAGAIDALRIPRTALDDALTVLTEYLAAVAAGRYTAAVRASEQVRIRTLATAGGADLAAWPE